MFDEIAQEDEDAEDYDLEALERRTEARAMVDDDAATLVGQPMSGSIAEDAVVFDIGDEEGHEGSDDDEPSSAKKRRTATEHHEGEEYEREGLMKEE